METAPEAHRFSIHIWDDNRNQGSTHRKWEAIHDTAILGQKFPEKTHKPPILLPEADQKNAEVGDEGQNQGKSKKNLFLENSMSTSAKQWDEKLQVITKRKD